MVNDPGSLGVVIGGSGNGEQIAANKVPGVRAALAWNDDTASSSREHNDANVVSVGRPDAHRSTRRPGWSRGSSRRRSAATSRHARRIAMLADYEKTGDLPELPTPPRLE